MSKVQFDAEAPAEEVPIVAMDDNDHEEEEDEEPEKNSKSFKESMASFINAEGRPIQWIYDRCNGHERVMDPDSKPCCCLMFPNGFLKLAPGKRKKVTDDLCVCVCVCLSLFVVCRRARFVTCFCIGLLDYIF